MPTYFSTIANYWCCLASQALELSRKIPHFVAKFVLQADHQVGGQRHTCLHKIHICNVAVSYFDSLMSARIKFC